MVVGKPNDVDAFTDAWEREDHDTLGALLGYPACCRAAFVRREAVGENLDPTWAFYSGSQNDTQANVLIQPEEARAGNILLRWLGITQTPHIPCAPGCVASADVMSQWAQHAEKLGFAQEVAWAAEMMTWPAEWSALHGIAETKLPVLKFVTRTLRSPGKRVVQWNGSTIPDAAAQGLHFPFKANPRQPLTSTTSFTRGSLHVLADACGTTPSSR